MLGFVAEVTRLKSYVHGDWLRPLSTTQDDWMSIIEVAPADQYFIRLGYKSVCKQQAAHSAS